MLSDFLIRMRALFRRNTVEREGRFHFEQQVEKFVQSGIPSQEARRRARLMFGATEEIKEECREARGVVFFENLLQDLRDGLRTIRKSPGFTAVVVPTLSLGGVSAALFTIVHGVLLSPLPFPRPDRLVSLWERDVVENSPFSAYNVVSGGVFADWQRQTTSFQQMALIGESSANLSGDGGSLPESIGTRQCSYNLFSMLGVQPPALRTIVHRRR